mmetsp:Transcript_117353/g.373930  ORF Transcript_117353/g.373930 Transcript_117353/m.373930 type:complete len:155 (+) Transcript_117353:1-465(+)
MTSPIWLALWLIWLALSTMHGKGPQDDIVDLACLVAPAAARRLLPRGDEEDRPQFVALAAAAIVPYRVAAPDDNLDDLVAIVVARPPPEKHKQRSWQHAEHARDAKAVTRAKLEADSSEGQANVAVAAGLNDGFLPKSAENDQTPLAGVIVGCV